MIPWTKFSELAQVDTRWATIKNLVDIRGYIRSLATQDAIPLSVLLPLTRRCYASDPLDHVHGIIGLAHDHSDIMSAHLLPDYGINLCELFEKLDEYLFFTKHRDDPGNGMNRLLY